MRVWLSKMVFGSSTISAGCVMMAGERQREQHCAHAGKECNKYDLTTIHCC